MIMVFGKRKARVLIVFGIAFLFSATMPRSSMAQSAGLSTMAVFDFSTVARTAALGMDYLAVHEADLGVGIDNPSLITPEMQRRIMLNYASMFGGGTFGSIAYAHDTKQFGTFLAALRFNNYGRFAAYDEQEHADGSFTAADYQLNIGWGLAIDSSFSFGATFKPTLSQYESYTAVAVAFDVAGSYRALGSRLTISALARNIGAQIVTFDQATERLPFELTAAMSYKLLRAPFRVFVAIRDMQRWNLSYNDPLEPTTVVDPFTGEVTSPRWLSETLDNIGRHLEAGVEVYLGRMIFVDLGYSYRKAREMRSIEAFNLSAISFGLGLKIKRFEFVYARNNYHLSQAPNYITLTYKF